MKTYLKNIISAILQFESRLILKKYNPKIIAVTGSVGKTSTKDTIYSVMSTSFCVRKSEKSFNSDIGIPLTILGCQNAWTNPIMWICNIWAGAMLILFKQSYPEWLILEVGADRPGDIKNISKWLKPDVVVLTKFAKTPVHIEYFRNREDIIREKRYLVEALKHNGILVVNGDDEDCMAMKELSKNDSIIYGTDKVSGLVASKVEVHYAKNKMPDGMVFRVDYKNDSVPVMMKGSLGMQNIYSALAALAVGLTQKVNLATAGVALAQHETPKGRMKIIFGIKNTILIDDTYNSSPVALASALMTLKEIKTKGRRIAVLGDMMELGKHSADEHYKAGSVLTGFCDILITVGVRSRRMAEGALDALMSEKNIFQFDNSTEAGEMLREMLKENDVVLLKGSQSIRMEKAVAKIMSEPQKAGELLVRQEEEWQMR
jgi:UDP-N-acetylmuramoyl-tripeptide--D-alanyl-D-alanine ligase